MTSVSIHSALRALSALVVVSVAVLLSCSSGVVQSTPTPALASAIADIGGISRTHDTVSLTKDEIEKSTMIINGIGAKPRMRRALEQEDPVQVINGIGAKPRMRRALEQEDPVQVINGIGAKPRINSRLQNLAFKLLDPVRLDTIQCGLLEPIARGRLDKLTVICLTGVNDRMKASTYMTRTLLRCLQGCPLLQLLELNAIRLVDTAEEWSNAIKLPFSSPKSPPPFKVFQDLLSRIPWRRSRPTPNASDAQVADVANVNAITQPRPSDISSRSEAFLPSDPLQETSELDEDYKAKYLTTIKLIKIFTKGPHRIHLYPQTVQTGPKSHASDRQFNADQHRLQISESLNDSSKIVGSSSEDALWSRLTTLRLVHCQVDDQMLESISDEFKRYRLKHLMVTDCAHHSTWSGKVPGTVLVTRDGLCR
ncbi:hypothetical protein BC939DRAFT_506425 [Gamsiella multidivaricata]|uniref:uncharacterized protein n=1 Tax=Gamsiella multidivaricata TaxID=101098 RepID=UPI0022210928|nr:uncharacterized protein BC939DRAFT_506425 [Gamsiella multidivaricata]KAI7818570.1 hypothetical protein BC939DRAFT_506425 [Gamsiella multidivaricata]